MREDRAETCREGLAEGTDAAAVADTAVADATEAAAAHAAHLLRGKTDGLTLRELMTLPSSAAPGAPRWVVLGEPGSGKSTLARHLTWELAKGADGPLPVYVALPALAAERQHPFEAAEKELCAAAGAGEGEGLARLLRERARKGGQVWLLLDGLDEVATGQGDSVEAALRQWAAALPEVPMAVFSRPEGYRGYRRPGAAFRAQARIRELSNEKQVQLLEKWLGKREQAQSVCKSLHLRPGLRDACRVPLILSLLAFLVRSGIDVPNNRIKLYGKSIEVLLEHGHGPGSRPVNCPVEARRVLGRLCLEFQEAPEASWTEADLLAMLARMRDEDESSDAPHGIQRSIGPGGACSTRSNSCKTYGRTLAYWRRRRAWADAGGFRIVSFASFWQRKRCAVLMPRARARGPATRWCSRGPRRSKQRKCRAGARCWALPVSYPRMRLRFSNSYAR